MSDPDYRPNGRADEAAREAALMRAAQMAANLGTVARGSLRDGPSRERGAEPRRPRRHRVLRFVVTLALGVGATLAWQTYGGEARRLVAAKLPEVSARVPALAPVIAQLPAALTNPPADGEAAPSIGPRPANAAPAAAPPPPPLPSPQVMQRLDVVARELNAVRFGLDRLTAVQNDINGAIAKLQAEEEARRAPPPPPKAAARPAPRPAPTAAARPAGPLPLTAQ